mmetsp:Transcript_10970/g.16127  ORF Transcript_10970/g.16127 Transcript_10970/m.16127 type:complete len:136 (+) Transcript_10970:113-520(+)
MCQQQQQQHEQSAEWSYVNSAEQQQEEQQQQSVFDVMNTSTLNATCLLQGLRNSEVLEKDVPSWDCLPGENSEPYVMQDTEFALQYLFRQFQQQQQKTFHRMFNTIVQSKHYGKHNYRVPEQRVIRDKQVAGRVI